MICLHMYMHDDGMIMIVDLKLSCPLSFLIFEQFTWLFKSHLSFFTSSGSMFLYHLWTICTKDVISSSMSYKYEKMQWAPNRIKSPWSIMKLCIISTSWSDNLCLSYNAILNSRFWCRCHRTINLMQFGLDCSSVQKLLDAQTSCVSVQLYRQSNIHTNKPCQILRRTWYCYLILQNVYTKLCHMSLLMIQVWSNT